jgi:hypothetical protein
MTFDLRSRAGIEIATLVKWEVPNFDTAYISDYSTVLSDGTNTYTNIGSLLGVSSTVSELTSTPGEITVSLSGIPTASITDILNEEIKGSAITVIRVYFDPVTHAGIDLDPGTAGVNNAIPIFKGIVTNYAISDSVDNGQGLAISTITLTCASYLEVLSNKTSGRRTNPSDFPNEKSMDRVRALANSNYNFGAP